MAENVIVSYSQEEINDIICNLNGLYTDLTSALTKQWLYALPCVNIPLLKEVFLYRWAIDGQLDANLLSTEELSNLVQKINNLANCAC